MSEPDVWLRAGSEQHHDNERLTSIVKSQAEQEEPPRPDGAMQWA